MVAKKDWAKELAALRREKAKAEKEVERIKNDIRKLTAQIDKESSDG
jgi:peptidoglycan hydrolase CwlO-like protein